MPPRRLSDSSSVEVTFSLPDDVDAAEVALCGDFNDWATDDIKLSQGDGGSWEVVIKLAPGTYRYRYLLDGYRWENAWSADYYAPNPYGSEDSVVVVA
jgi:1,4-alpha-glucan branching enzyme